MEYTLFLLRGVIFLFIEVNNTGICSDGIALLFSCYHLIMIQCFVFYQCIFVKVSCKFILVELLIQVHMSVQLGNCSILCQHDLVLTYICYSELVLTYICQGDLVLTYICQGNLVLTYICLLCADADLTV